MIGTSRSALTPVLVLAGQLAVPAAFHGLNPDRPTFVDDIAPILHENCASCHQPGEIGPMALRTWSEVRPWARSIARAVENRDMPPWDADRVTATVGRGPTAKIEGVVQDDGSLLLDLSEAGGGAEVRGTPAENEVLVTLPNG